MDVQVRYKNFNVETFHKVARVRKDWNGDYVLEFDETEYSDKTFDAYEVSSIKIR